MVTCYLVIRNDITNYSGPGHPYGGTAIYSRILLREGYPYSHNIHEIEFTNIKNESQPDITIIGLYRSPRLTISRLLSALCTILDEDCSSQT